MGYRAIEEEEKKVQGVKNGRRRGVVGDGVPGLKRGSVGRRVLEGGVWFREKEEARLRRVLQLLIIKY